MIKLSIIGNLGADAEVKNHNGKEFVSFRVAHTDRFTQDGQTKETTTWVSCILNGNGGNLLPYLKRGTKVFCHGDFSVRLYRYNGEINAGLNLSVREIELCGGQRNETQTERPSEDNFDEQF